MNKDQKTKLSMYLATQSYLDANTSTWSMLAAMTAAKKNLDENLLELKDLAIETSKGSNAVTEDKGILRTRIAQKAQVTGGALLAYGNRYGISELKNLEATFTDVYRQPDANLVPFTTPIVTLARKYLDKIADYGVQQDGIVDLETTMDDFLVSIGQPRRVISTRKAANRDMDTLFRETDDMLNNEMDNIMLYFKYSNPTFYNGYAAARTLVD